jgi:hypothetical protein
MLHKKLLFSYSLVIPHQTVLFTQWYRLLFISYSLRLYGNIDCLVVKRVPAGFACIYRQTVTARCSVFRPWVSTRITNRFSLFYTCARINILLQARASTEMAGVFKQIFVLRLFFVICGTIGLLAYYTENRHFRPCKKNVKSMLSTQSIRVV